MLRKRYIGSTLLIDFIDVNVLFSDMINPLENRENINLEKLFISFLFNPPFLIQNTVR